MTIVVTAGAEARCARRFTGDSCGRSVERKAVAADVMDSCNGEITFGITVCIVLKVYIGSVKNRAREGTDGSRVDGLAFVLIRIRA